MAICIVLTSYQTEFSATPLEIPRIGTALQFCSTRHLESRHTSLSSRSLYEWKLRETHWAHSIAVPLTLPIAILDRFLRSISSLLQVCPFVDCTLCPLDEGLTYGVRDFHGTDHRFCFVLHSRCRHPCALEPGSAIRSLREGNGPRRPEEAAVTAEVKIPAVFSRLFNVDTASCNFDNGSLGSCI